MPDIASVVDDLCFIRSMWGAHAAYGGAILAMNTGSDRSSARLPYNPGRLRTRRFSRTATRASRPGESPRPCSDTE